MVTILYLVQLIRPVPVLSNSTCFILRYTFIRQFSNDLTEKNLNKKFMGLRENPRQSERTEHKFNALWSIVLNIESMIVINETKCNVTWFYLQTGSRDSEQTLSSVNLVNICIFLIYVSGIMQELCSRMLCKNCECTISTKTYTMPKYIFL